MPCPEIITAADRSSHCRTRPQQVDAAAIGQPHVEQIDVGGRAASFLCERRRRLEHGDPIALALEDQPQRPADVRLVVDDDDVPFACHDGSVTLNAAPPSSPGITVTSPPDSSAFFLAIERPSPMPCFLKVIVGSNSVAGDLLAQARPGVVHIDHRAFSPSSGQHEDRAARTGRLRRILQQIGQDPVDQVRRRVHARTVVVEPEPIRHARVRRTQQRDALADHGVDVELLGMHRRLARELGERPDAPLERLDFADHDLDRLVHERAARIRAGCRACISSTVSRIGVSEFFSSCAVLRASDCQLAMRVRCTSRSRLSSS